MVFSATFNNISAISWRYMLLVEETEGPEENHGLPRVTDKLHHTMLHRGHLTISGIRTHNFSYLISSEQHRSLTLNNIENKSAS